ncbi:S1 domain-containing post-transcriptional regulator GSP13 [Alkalibacillus almallahensis]|uniref:S1 domain-containing post-transcriptional regulator GSP13 n=1 Tax=Alkalibacillus almallahensis TaxID=1379154 RepID=UPI00141FC10E|nr:S1 domain-containing post-transcriptional regulator GSP13 [Alkalibacillus almallahensis]NIK12149.1 general stress protein 13 [Alkalibacillus almallahensis]
MNVQEGDIIKGEVTGIQPYGAFVKIDDDRQGLVHISEITHGYVKDVHDYVSVGEVIQVKVVDAEPSEGKFSLSIRATQSRPIHAKTRAEQIRDMQHNQDENGFNILKDKLNEWIEQSKDREQTYRH